MSELETGTQLIVVKQLPVIEDQLRTVKPQVEKRVADALALVCTPETYKTVKAERSSLNKEFAALEDARKKVKAAVFAPYDAFDAVYKECVANIYKYADEQLKAKIKAVEDDLKAEMEAKLREFYKEYAESIGITDETIAPFESAGIKIGLSDSSKSLRKKAADFLDKVESELHVIQTQEYSEEVMAEYRGKNDLAAAIITVRKRHEAIEAERKAMEERAQAQAAIADVEAAVAETVAGASDEISIPTSAPDPEQEERVYEVRFSVKSTLPKLKELKQFLKDGGYEYASIANEQ